LNNIFIYLNINRIFLNRLNISAIIKTNMVEKTCQICTEDFNKSSNKIFECFSCKEICCTKCHKTYLENRTICDCMFCNENITIQNMIKFHTKTYIFSTGKYKNKGFREWESEAYYKQEHAYFQQTQSIIDADYEVEEMKKKVNELNNIYDTMMISIHQLNIEFRTVIQNNQKDDMYKVAKEIDKIKSESKKIKIDINKQKKLITRFNLSRINNNSINKNEINKCCHQDCDGFLNSKWICNKCNKSSCKDCREPKEENHTCDEEKIKNVKFALQTTQGCPKCGERIHRIYGCDQMYCPLCKIIFSYSTGKELKNTTVHQPDAVRELRRNGTLNRDVRDIPCGGINTYSILYSEIKLMKPQFIRIDKPPIGIEDTITIRIIRQIYLIRFYRSLMRFILEWEDENARIVNENPNEQYELNLKYRLSYMKGLIDKETYKKKIYTRYKYVSYERDYREIYSSMCIILSDLVRNQDANINNLNTTKKKVKQIMENITSPSFNETIIKILKVIKIYNKEFYNISKIYNKPVRTLKFVEFCPSVNSYYNDLNSITDDYEGRFVFSNSLSYYHHYGDENHKGLNIINIEEPYNEIKLHKCVSIKF